MNITEFFAVVGILAIMWWIGRRVAQAMDQYELMKRQCAAKQIERREPATQPRKKRSLSYGSSASKQSTVT
jgi:hypothetical protein